MSVTAKYAGDVKTLPDGLSEIILREVDPDWCREELAVTSTGALTPGTVLELKGGDWIPVEGTTTGSGSSAVTTYGRLAVLMQATPASASDYMALCAVRGCVLNGAKLVIDEDIDDDVLALLPERGFKVL